MMMYLCITRYYGHSYMWHDKMWVVFLNLPNTQLDKLQSILNSAARAITYTSKYSRITPILKYLRWLKIQERIHYINYFLLPTLQYLLINLSILSKYSKQN